MRASRRILAAVLLAASLGLSTAGCGGRQNPGSSPDVFAPRMPADLAVPGEALHPIGLAPRGDTLEQRVASVIEDLDARGIVAFAPPLPDDAEILDGFARYVSFSEPIGEDTVRHTIFVTFGDWSADRERAFIRAFWPLPSRLATDGGRPVLHWVGDVAPPPTIDYLFGGQWWGALESAMLDALATLPDNAAEIVALEARVRATFERFGMPTVAGDGGDSLAAVLAAIPPRTEGLRPPAGTLVAAGILLGHELLLTDAGLEWFVVDEDDAATFYAISVDGDPSTMLRPIDFMLQAWESGVTDPVHGYLHLAAEHVGAHRASGDAEGSE